MIQFFTPAVTLGIKLQFRALSSELFGTQQHHAEVEARDTNR